MERVGRIKRKEYWSFEKCREHLKNFKFSNKEFLKYLKENEDISIPTNPYKVFKNEFMSLQHFLSNDNISVQKNKYYSYCDSIKFLKNKIY